MSWKRRKFPWVFLASALSIVTACGGGPAGSSPCQVTQPNGLAPAGEAPSDLWFEQNGLTTVLWPQGTIVFQPGGPGEIRDNGDLAMKFPFTRGPGVVGALDISGRRLDGQSLPAFGEIPDGYGDTGFQASAIVFPSPGCWEITVRAGTAQMIFIQRVVKTDPPASP
jgi:hypothetical protein